MVRLGDLYVKRIGDQWQPVSGAKWHRIADPQPQPAFGRSLRVIVAACGSRLAERTSATVSNLVLPLPPHIACAKCFPKEA